jgi:transcriptional/translational regulatory protein YebC/TACO1
MIMEKKADNSTKKIVVQAIIDKIENEDEVNEIKTQIVEGYKKPEVIAQKNSDQEGYTPDVISVHTGRKDLYTVELDAENFVLEKWRLFSLYSKKSNGNFSIVTPKDNLEQVRNLLKTNQIHAKLIYFS